MTGKASFEVNGVATGIVSAQKLNVTYTEFEREFEFNDAGRSSVVIVTSPYAPGWCVVRLTR
jgi:hypothetical protein